MASYQVEVTRQLRQEIRQLPGNVRQRVIRSLRALEHDPHPHNSRQLDAGKAGMTLEEGAALWRIRMSSWRVIYLVEDEWSLVTVLAIRKRPPYQYNDLEQLVRDS